MAGHTKANIPAELRARPTLDRLTELIRAPKGRLSPIEQMAIRMDRHLSIARDHDSMPDGYPTKASGANPGMTGRTPVVAEDERVELTSVEAAYEKRLHWKDRHDWRTATAWELFQTMVLTAATLEQLLAKLDGEAAPIMVAAPGDERWCQNHREHGLAHEPRADDGGVHCRWCADFNRARGQFPNRDVLEYRHRFGKIPAKELERMQPTAAKAS